MSCLPKINSCANRAICSWRLGLSKSKERSLPSPLPNRSPARYILHLVANKGLSRTWQIEKILSIKLLPAMFTFKWGHRPWKKAARVIHDDAFKSLLPLSKQDKISRKLSWKHVLRLNESVPICRKSIPSRESLPHEPSKCIFSASNLCWHFSPEASSAVCAAALFNKALMTIFNVNRPGH